MDNERLLFQATITPHRSLGRRGFALTMGFVGIVGFFVSIPFYLMGAWPIVGFMGADIALIYWAFRANYRAARSYEQVFLSRILLLVRAVTWRGEIAETTFNPVWTRLEREDHPEIGLESLAIVQGRQRVEIGACLGREERADFADAFARALATAKL